MVCHNTFMASSDSCCEQIRSSSPLLPASSPLNLSTAEYSSRRHGKPKKPPTVTPKRFNRFFSPRSSTYHTVPTRQSSSGRKLRDITRNAVNSRSSQLSERSLDFSYPRSTCSNKYVACSIRFSPGKWDDAVSCQSSPIQSSPCKRIKLCGTDEDDLSENEHSPLQDSEGEQRSATDENTQTLPQSIRRLTLSGPNGKLLKRTFGVHQTGPSVSNKSQCGAWYDETEGFHTTSEGYHSLPKTALPFCAVSCNSNSLAAISDESGSIRLLETAANEEKSFESVHLVFKPHTNAVMDMAFTPDDHLLATASGDQTAHVIDMFTQRTVYVMVGHASSVKQVRFQPGESSVLATSSRDGSVRLWDTRCKGSRGSIMEVQLGCENAVGSGLAEMKRGVSRISTYDEILNAHSIVAGNSFDHRLFDHRDVAGKGELKSSNRRGGISVTALSFLSERRPHILLTSSEASTSVNLWDIRSRYSNRRGSLPVPLSSTKQPDSHTRHRQFGVSSLALSGDAARLYALSRDSTVYAYSTNHIILGSAIDLSPESNPRRHQFDSARLNEGTGPLYGFRHPRFQASTFYVKLALRPASANGPELLAVGSSDSCAILFPTDERYHYRNVKQIRSSPLIKSQSSTCRSQEQFSSRTSLPRLVDTIPIYSSGSALTRGHHREVTSVAWTKEGNLITVSDDFSARCWREGEKARDLRNLGEGAGQRWRSGWAEADEPSLHDDSYSEC